jgi:hypothetical protein
MVIVNVLKNNTYTVSDVFQWDRNRILKIYGLKFTSVPEIHFAKNNMKLAIVKQATIDEDGIAKVEIPNSLLEDANPIKIYVCIYNGDEFISRYSFKIDIKSRVKPADYIEEDEEKKIYSYNALENLITDTVVNLELSNENFHREIIQEFNVLGEQIKNAVTEDVTEILKNIAIADADTLDGFQAEEFVLESKPGRTVFNSDGSIITDYDDGSRETVVFNADGSITTTRNTIGMGVKTEVTKFNADGSITVEVS